MPLGSQGVHAGRGRGADGEINVDKQQSSFIWAEDVPISIPGLCSLKNRMNTELPKHAIYVCT